jgi:DNA-binding response OmpR family regulator
MKTGRNNSINCKSEILVAEDSPKQAAMLKCLLESSNYKVLLAPDGQQALEKLSQNKPALVISDIVMPVLNGYELCEKIKSDESTAHIPVILMTSLSDPEEVIEGLSCGADSFITKPFNNEFLLSSIEKILSERTQFKSDREKLGLEINHGGKKRQIRVEAEKVVSFMLNTYQAAINSGRITKAEWTVGIIVKGPDNKTQIFFNYRTRFKKSFPGFVKYYRDDV